MDSLALEHTVLESSTIAAAPDQVSADLAGETVILNLKSGMYYGLGQVGAYIWSLVQEPRTFDEIRDAILKEYEVEPGRCDSDTVALLEQLADAGLIEIR